MHSRWPIELRDTSVKCLDNFWKDQIVVVLGFQ